MHFDSAAVDQFASCINLNQSLFIADRQLTLNRQGASVGNNQRPGTIHNQVGSLGNDQGFIHQHLFFQVNIIAGIQQHLQPGKGDVLGNRRTFHGSRSRNRNITIEYTVVGNRTVVDNNGVFPCQNLTAVDQVTLGFHPQHTACANVQLAGHDQFAPFCDGQIIGRINFQGDIFRKDHLGVDQHMVAQVETAGYTLQGLQEHFAGPDLTVFRIFRIRLLG